MDPVEPECPTNPDRTKTMAALRRKRPQDGRLDYLDFDGGDFVRHGVPSRAGRAKAAPHAIEDDNDRRRFERSLKAYASAAGAVDPHVDGWDEF
jgi:hypothetical protein